jgi:LmbE family N-acetylglucosaminyl deacetylase
MSSRYSPAFIGDGSPVLVVSPHPDDDVIGCGGTLAWLAERGTPCTVAYVTDGSRSHPGSTAFAPERIARIREGEARRALRQLGVRVAPVFLRETDGSLATLDDARRTRLSAAIATLIERTAAAVVFAPWRRDVHADHVAVAGLVDAALAGVSRRPALFAYSVWREILGTPADDPLSAEAITFDVSLSRRHRAQKRRAIGAHRSQISNLISDDPRGFRVTAAMLAAWTQPHERFFVAAPAP